LSTSKVASNVVALLNFMGIIVHLVLLHTSPKHGMSFNNNHQCINTRLKFCACFILYCSNALYKVSSMVVPISHYQKLQQIC
jgi:hypothetical protein